jgi:hypothetical protein
MGIPPVMTCKQLRDYLDEFVSCGDGERPVVVSDDGVQVLLSVTEVASTQSFDIYPDGAVVLL